MNQNTFPFISISNFSSFLLSYGEKNRQRLLNSSRSAPLLIIFEIRGDESEIPGKLM
jgi:hypothetical protein